MPEVTEASDQQDASKESLGGACDRPEVGSEDCSHHNNNPTLRANCYLIITNISKRPNVRSLLLTAAAFGCKEVFVAGQKKFSFDPDGPDVPSQLKYHIKSGGMKIVQFEKLEECIAHIKSTENNGDNTEAGSSSPIKIFGVEIDETAVDLEDEPFDGDTAFMMGNEGQGMNQKQMLLCDGFVRIAQYGAGTASLNVNVACSIVLHRFHHWARADNVRKYCDICPTDKG